MFILLFYIFTFFNRSIVHMAIKAFARFLSKLTASDQVVQQFRGLFLGPFLSGFRKPSIAYPRRIFNTEKTAWRQIK